MCCTSLLAARKHLPLSLFNFQPTETHPGSGYPADRMNKVEVDAGDTLADLNAEPEAGGIRAEESL